MLPLRIAWRFLRSSPVQSALIIAGIAVGISAQIFVGSLIMSLQSSLVDHTIGSAPQITLQSPTEGDPVVYSDKVASVVTTDPRIKRDSITKVRTITSLFSNGSESAPLNLIGGQLPELNGIYKVSDRMKSGQASLKSDEIMIGTDFARGDGIGCGLDCGGAIAPSNRAIERFTQHGESNYIRRA